MPGDIDGIRYSVTGSYPAAWRGRYIPWLAAVKGRLHGGVKQYHENGEDKEKRADAFVLIFQPVARMDPRFPFFPHLPRP